ncbi:MAG TPA: archease [Methanosarcinales archaeon]|nr:archease [Methanosarcinales archaeon]
MKTMEKSYEYLEHTADSKFRAYGNTIENAFENAALAMFNVMINTSNIQPIEKEDIKLESENLDELLYSWLSELLYLFEVEGIVFSNFKIDYIKKNSGYTLEGHASGEKIDLKKHVFECQVKAVTFHELDIAKTDKGYCVQVIVDT